MRVMMYVVIGSVRALKDQNTDADGAVAVVLKRCCNDRLDQEIEKSEELLMRTAAGKTEAAFLCEID